MTARVPVLPPAVEAAIAALRDQPIAATEKGFGVVAAIGRSLSAAIAASTPGGSTGTRAVIWRE